MKNVYIKGFVGNLGTYILIDEKYDELCSYFNKEFIDNAKKTIYNSMYKDGINPSLIMSFRGDKVNICRGEQCEPNDLKIIDSEPIGKGGILTALWKLCDRNKWGLKYSLRRIPILQGTVEIANYFDINPYRLLTTNSYIIACESVGDDVLSYHVGADTIRPQYLTYIGDITNTKKRVRIDGETEAFLTKDYKDEIDKIIKGYTKSNG